MRDGKCTRCGKTAVHAKHGALNSGAIELLVTAWRRGWLTAYVCVSCGYSELYLEDGELLSIVADKWPIVASEIQ
jgi:predicted nucleic-acid-binding Zn-ribbon protein